MYLKEACVESVEEAIKAEIQGADRLEYCSALEWEGLTPDYEQVHQVLDKVSIPVMVMIRPRKGDFNYSEEEFQVMKEQILRFKKLGITGVVFGLLKDGSVDLEKTRSLARIASPLEVCFHKAIDELEDPVTGVITLLEIPEITRILTSGGARTALDGREKLREMLKVAEGSISIMPAGKVRPSNIGSLHQILGAKEYHGRGIV